jgi:hypothetical protein
VPRIDPSIRAAALAELHAGEQPAIVAERYRLDPAKVRVWKQRYVTPVVANVTPPVTVRQPTLERQQHQIGELILDLLAAKLQASTAIAKAASDETWLRSQSGSELAALGEWLDTTAFAIGDRLAGRRSEPDDTGDRDA